ncbi:MAG TPA: UbiA family prenyltransferase [Terracidiphilus sp.]|nr:UbiA family prenyltransferase [Terracidiphilus sp.]
MRTRSLPAATMEPRTTIIANRWWIYQRERFPVLAHAPVILAFSLSAVAYSALLRGAGRLPGWKPCLVAFASSFLSFLQLRLADEFKDFEEDAKYRPYRPVPRGLIKLRELAWLWAGCMALQLALSLWLAPRLAILLGITWIYFGLMTKEFFARRWLKARPVVYMVSHMAIMPLVDLYATACDWVPAHHVYPPRGLLWFLLVSLFNGMVIEIGRKIRVPQDEEKGVETYSFLWSRRVAVLVWVAMMAVAWALACVAAAKIHFAAPVAVILASAVAVAAALSAQFLRTEISGAGKRLETMAGVWSLVLYLSLGVLPLALRHWGMA